MLAVVLAWLGFRLVGFSPGRINGYPPAALSNCLCNGAICLKNPPEIPPFKAPSIGYLMCYSYRDSDPIPYPGLSWEGTQYTAGEPAVDQCLVFSAMPSRLTCMDIASGDQTHPIPTIVLYFRICAEITTGFHQKKIAGSSPILEDAEQDTTVKIKHLCD